MTSLQIKLIAVSLSIIAAAPADAQEASSPLGNEAVSAEEGEGIEGVRLPPNVTITAPDGTPLPPELLKKVLATLGNDPSLQAVLNTSSIRTVRRTVGDMEIVVTAKPPRGSVLGNVPPTRTFNPLDIRAYGARDINELVAGLSAETASIDLGRKTQPIVLLNGKRISRFEEIASFPTEAIERLEVFPEELALKYGYAANRKVVNIVTFNPFSSKSTIATHSMALKGGHATSGLSGRLLKLTSQSRYALNLSTEISKELRESERNIVEPPQSIGQSRFRSLLPETRQFSIDGNFGKEILGDHPFTATANILSLNSEALLGFGADGPLRQKVQTMTFGAGTTLSGQIPGWFWFGSANYDLTTSDTSTDLNSLSKEIDFAGARKSVFSTDVSFIGSLLALPAGSLSATVKTEYSREGIRSRVQRSGSRPSNLFNRDRGILNANFDMPLLGPSYTALPWLGTLSLNAQAGLEHVSGFRMLANYGYGVYWSPIEPIRLYASASNKQSAPSIEQIGSPTIVTPNFRTFDYIRGETVDITQSIGGNPDLRADDRRTINVGISIRPIGQNVSFVANYVATRIINPVFEFPVITQPIQSAFPDRFERRGDGRLSAIDGTPLNLSESRQSTLRLGMNFTRALGKLPTGMDLIVSPSTDGTIPPGTLPANSRVIENPPGTPLPPEIQNAISRVYFSVYHTWHLQDTIVITDGGEAFDLLNGFALDGRNGRPRHELEFSGGLFKRGIGIRLNVRWESASALRGLPSGTGDNVASLRFSSDPTADVSLFLNLEDRITGQVPQWMKKLQLSLSAQNLFDTRIKVRDQLGQTPLRYQPAYLDPTGPMINFSVRKIF